MGLTVCFKCGRPHNTGRTHCPRCHKPKHRKPQAQLNRRIYRTAQWQTVRHLALQRDGNQCQHCGTERDLIVHHDVEIAPGTDPYDLDNLETLCRSCHAREHNRRTHNQ